MSAKILELKEWNVVGNWYAPERFLKAQDSVTRCKLLDTTSSAGDWSGLFAQIIDGKTYIIPFYQENQGGIFLLTTGDIFRVYNFEDISDFNWLESLIDWESLYCL